jgi:tagatose-6-phosphate ketose/aldose isomerase
MSNLTRFATWREIHAQPAIWRSWGAALDVAGLRAWVAAQDVEEVWFCGAGSSAYVGEIVVAALEGVGGPRLRAVATTDLVSRPRAYLAGRRPLVADAPRLNITCNAGSALAAEAAGQRVIVLPEATHDAGFAMTSSFTTMLLTALAVFDLAVPAAEVAGRMAGLGQALANALPDLDRAAAVPDRAVFVGAGALAFAAREAALKVMELSAGRIPALWDTSLGFRHGPKSFVTAGTAIHVFRAPDALARRYDDDLLAELRGQFPQARVTGVDLALDWPEGWGAVLPVVQAQLLAVRWSDALGLPVDDPFAGQGTLTRVVSGVQLYPVAP